jgi:hypothetical protein
MKATMFQDPRANDLLSRVSEDVSLLRQDVGNLFTHTARHTLPASAHKLADQAKTSLAAGRTFTAEQLNSLKSQIKQPAAAWVGGAAALGLLAAGAYMLLHSNNHNGTGCNSESQKDS